MSDAQDVRSLLLAGLTDEQKAAVSSQARRLLVVAGAGSGKTEIMARRVAWWVRVDGVPKSAIVAFTFTKKAAEEMKFRIRKWLQSTAASGDDVTLGDMWVGTIHSFCVDLLRLLHPSRYGHYDVLEDAARMALVQRAYWDLGLRSLQDRSGKGQYATVDYFLRSYDLLNEFDQLQVALPEGMPPMRPGKEQSDWCKSAVLLTDVGDGEEAVAFGTAAARYYALLCCRRFLDFSTSQTEALRLLADGDVLAAARTRWSHVVVDEVQDVNEVQDRLVRTLVGDDGSLTAVGDHRQAIFGWRGGLVELMARLDRELKADPQGATVDLSANFRSTPGIITASNAWAATLEPLLEMATPPMKHGKETRVPIHDGEVAALRFDEREEEAAWIARAVRRLCPDDATGAVHDAENEMRGISFADVAVLIRSATDARTYMRALEGAGIPAVFRAGPDLFGQPEVLLFLAALGIVGGDDAFVGGARNGLPRRVADSLGCEAEMNVMIPASCDRLRNEGLELPPGVDERIVSAARLMARRVAGQNLSAGDVAGVADSELRSWLRQSGGSRRVFPQQLFHLLLAEAGVGDWVGNRPRLQSVMFHLGQLSTLITGVEMPGWVESGQLRYQIRALAMWGSSNARAEEAPLLVQPEAVTITTIHAAKGMEYAAVFVADVVSQRFPSSYAKRVDSVAYGGAAAVAADPALLADDDNLNNERRLLYVAMTRAERFLFVTTSRPSAFFKELEPLLLAAGAVGGEDEALAAVEHGTKRYDKELRLVSSFSDLRYYLECPHDYFLRKVLGFAPTIDQAFGYGRAVHNLMREIHSNPGEWAALAGDSAGLREKLRDLAEGGGFYLRYTAGEPLLRMRNKAVEVVAGYVERYGGELSHLAFEPERAFETLIPEAQTLISGAMDVIRLDEPPRVTLIDFKSGKPGDPEFALKLDEREMKLQVMLYGLAAKKELEYDPNLGLVRYLDVADGQTAELRIPLDAEALDGARKTVAETANAIRERRFSDGPQIKPRTPGLTSRCQECDNRLFCPHEKAVAARAARP